MKPKNIKKIFKILIRKPFLQYYFDVYVVKNQIIIEDVKRNNLLRRGDKNQENLKKQFEQLMLNYPDFAYLFFWRLNKRTFGQNLFYSHYNFIKIFKSSNLDGGTVFFHPFGTVINAKKIGKNFVFRNGLTIGNKSNDNFQLPTIGDNVEVGANVVIIGNIEIGNNVIIGAGAVVVKDIPSNVIVAGNPARIIKNIN